MPRRDFLPVIVLFIGLTFSACGGKPTPDVQAIETQTAAKIFATQTASVPTRTEYTPTDAAPATDARPAGVPLSWVRYSDSTGRFTVWHPAGWEARLSDMEASRDSAYFNTPNATVAVSIIGGMGTDDVLDEKLQTLVIDTVRETLPNITIGRREGIGSGRYVSFTAEDPAHTMTYHVAGVALASPPQNIAVGFLASPTKPLSTTERQELVDAVGSISLSSPRTETSSLIVTTRQPTATPEATATQTVTPQAVVDAVKSLRRMESATEIGISNQEYSSRMIDLKGDVGEALAQLPEGELRKELTLAMEAYTDALVVWNYKYALLTADEEPGQSWAKKYPNIVSEIEGVKFVGRATAVPAIWAAAGERVKRASALIAQ